MRTDCVAQRTQCSVVIFIKNKTKQNRDIGIRIADSQ